MLKARAMIAFAAALALLAPASARAEDLDTHALRVRFAEGRALEEVGRWADALTRFEDVARARPTAHVTFHIALCLDHLGRFLAAEQVYRAAITAAGAGAPDVAADARARLAELEPRIPRIFIALEGEPRGVALLLNGAPVSAATFVRVDPGPHTVVATRDGIPIAAAVLSVQERRTKLVPLRIYSARAPRSLT
jgi:tetratricopeptide (TPR) repeat protein